MLTFRCKNLPTFEQYAQYPSHFGGGKLMGYKVHSKCITKKFGVLYVSVNVKSYKTTTVWKEGRKLLTKVYPRR